MKTISTVVFALLLSLPQAWKGPVYEPILNSFGHPGIKILDDTVYVDTTGGGKWKKLLADTSRAVYIAYAGSITYGYAMRSDSADTDSMMYQEQVLCCMAGLGWIPALMWKAWAPIDSILQPIYSVSGYGQREVNFSTCDSVKFVASVLATTAHGDTIYLDKRTLRLRETE